MKPKVFLSYSSKDKVFADKLTNALMNTKSFDVWQDVFNLRSGDKIDEQIKKAIDKETQITLFYLSKNALESEWVKQEFEWASNKSRGSVYFVIDEEETRSLLQDWEGLPASRVLVVNNESFHEPLLELTTSMLANFHEHYYPGVQVGSVLEAGFNKGIEKIQFGRFTKEDDDRLEYLILNANRIRMMTINSGNVLNIFKDAFKVFADKGGKLFALFANEASEFYNENSVLVDPFFDRNKDNENLVPFAVARLRSIFTVYPDNLRIRQYNTLFRLPLLIFDVPCKANDGKEIVSQYAHLTINLPPSESIEGMTLELMDNHSELPTGQRNPSYIHTCVKHFDAVFLKAKAIEDKLPKN